MFFYFKKEDQTKTIIFKQVYMTKEKKKDEKETPPDKNTPRQHKYIEKEYYRCYCQKIYTTYPALYLHIKNKHDSRVSMEMKKKLKPTKEWSGNIKKIIYEFFQFNDQENSSEKGRKLTPQNSKDLSKQSVVIKKEQSDEKDISDHKVSKKKQTTLLTMQEDSIRSIFSKYYRDQENYDRSQIRELRFKLIQNFETFLNKNYRQIDPQGKYVNFCVENTAQQVPYMFNSFFAQMSKRGWEPTVLISELQRLGWWLNKNQYTQYMVVREQQYQQYKELLQ